jgi:Carboxypeptidase regulatory-like domain
LLEWEVFMPKKLRVRNFSGDAIPEALVSHLVPGEGGIVLSTGLQGQPLAGVVADSSGAAISGAQVTVTHTGTGATAKTVADSNGAWRLSGFPAGRAQIRVSSPGFKVVLIQIVHSADRAETYPATLEVASISETVTVSGIQAPGKDTKFNELQAQRDQQAQNQASSNVLDLQRRVAGVLPVRMDVPHAGNSYRFLRPLVLNAETRLKFDYAAGR